MAASDETLNARTDATVPTRMCNRLARGRDVNNLRDMKTLRPPTLQTCFGEPIQQELASLRIPSPYPSGKQNRQKQCRWLGHGTGPVGGRELRQHQHLLISEPNRPAADTLAEITRQVDEIGNRDRSVVIHISHLPGCAANGIEVRCEVDEVADGDGAIEIQIADARIADQYFISVESADALERTVCSTSRAVVVAHRTQTEGRAGRGGSNPGALIEAA